MNGWLIAGIVVASVAFYFFMAGFVFSFVKTEKNRWGEWRDEEIAIALFWPLSSLVLLAMLTATGGGSVGTLLQERSAQRKNKQRLEELELQKSILKLEKELGIDA